MPDLIVPLTAAQADRLRSAFPSTPEQTSNQRVQEHVKAALRRAVLEAEMTRIRGEHDTDTAARLAAIEAELKDTP